MPAKQHRQGLCEPGGTHNPWSHLSVGTGCGLLSPTHSRTQQSAPPGRGHCNSFITKFQSPCTVFTMSLFKGSAVLLGLGREVFFFS